MTAFKRMSLIQVLAFATFSTNLLSSIKICSIAWATTELEYTQITATLK